MARVLIADDDPSVLNMTRVCLVHEGHEVQAVNNGIDALASAIGEPPDLVVLDVMLPDMDGFEICRMLRTHSHLAHTPVLLLTSRAASDDKSSGFAAGADDYLTKPFDITEFRWRTRALLRRVLHATRPEEAPKNLTVGGISLDVQNGRAWVRGQGVRLRPLECEILHHLMRHHDQLVPTATLLQEVFGYPAGVGTTTGLRTHVKHLREKLEEDRLHPRLIVNEPGRGYLFNSRPWEAEEA